MDLLMVGVTPLHCCCLRACYCRLLMLQAHHISDMQQHPCKNKHVDMIVTVSSEVMPMALRSLAALLCETQSYWPLCCCLGGTSLYKSSGTSKAEALREHEAFRMHWHPHTTWPGLTGCTSAARIGLPSHCTLPDLRHPCMPLLQGPAMWSEAVTAQLCTP